MTGESQPVHKGPGDTLVGGTINLSGAVTMRATKVGSDTVLAQIGALVAKAQNSKAPGQRLADRAAAVLVVVAVGAGVLTFVGWTVLAGAGGVFYHSLGWSLRPEVSARLMSASSIIVALNAVSLRRAKI